MIDTTLMMRLGIVLTGSNSDLEAPPKEPKDDDSDGNGDADADEDEDPSKDGNGDAGDEDEDGDDADEDGDDADEDGDEEDGDSNEDGNGEDEDDPSKDGNGDEEDEDSNGDGNADSNEEDDADEEGSDSSDDADQDGDADSDADSDEGTEGEAGGFNSDHQDDGIDTKEVAESLMDDMENGADTGLVDNNDALADAIEDEAKEELEKQERPWRPYDPTLDEIKLVYATEKSIRSAKRMLSSVKGEISFIKNKLRSKFLQARINKDLHGVRKGRGLSERRLVNSMVELRAGQRPTRPDWLREKKEECSLAAAVVIDQSGSMGSMRLDAGKASLAIASALDRLGSPCLVVGPRNGKYGGSDGYFNDDWNDAEGKPKFHRAEGVIIDVFKNWEEPMNKCEGRFGRVQATGSTPLSDGIQYAMQELNNRSERFRVVIVITDGYPDNMNVVRYQIRKAKEAGVEIVGVGIASGAYGVEELFPLHVAVHQVKALPKRLLEVLDSIMFPKRGRKIKLDGKIPGRMLR